jgi:DNA-binding XRE family transcriptional regulator
MRTRPFADLATDLRADPERWERIAQLRRTMKDALTPAELRQERGVTQREVAETLRVTQVNVSRIEHEEDLDLATLRAYVAALGGALDLRAVFPERTVTIADGQKS